MTDGYEAGLSSDLYDVLEACTNGELAPVVDALVKAPVSVLKITRAFERHHPDHARYTDQIGDEAYRLSLLALGRSDGKRPSYEEMVSGLLKQIGLPAASSDLGGGEALLLNTFSRQHLSTVPPADRRRLVDEASVAAAAAAKGLLSSEAWPPLASLLVQVAYLRRKLVEEGRMSLQHYPAKTSAPRSPTLVNEGANALVVRADDGDPILSLATAPANGDVGWRGITDGGKALNALTPLLKAVQPLVAADQMLKGGNYMRVTIPGSAKLDRIAGSAAYHGSARDAAGKFCSIRLDAASAAKLASPTAFLTLASALAEQKQLEAIEKSLGDIKSAIADVSRFQNDERRAVLNGSIRYFQQIARSVLTGELANEVLQEIEHHEVDLVRMQEHLAEELHGQITALRAIKKETFGSGKYVKAIQEAQAILDRMYDELFLCLRARACGYELLCAYPGREAGKRARLEDIGRALDLFSPTGEATIGMDEALREKMVGVSSYETKALLLGRENVLLNRLSTERANILDGLRSAQRKVLEGGEPISIDLRVQDGQPVAIRLA